MKKTKDGRRLRFSLIMGITLSLMTVSIAALAAILPQLSRQRTNDFEPASPGIAIGENDSSPKQRSEKTLPLAAGEGKYTVEKKVEIACTGNEEYVKAALVPQWYDEDGRLCGGLGEFSDLGIAQEPNEQLGTQQIVSSQNEKYVILTYLLAPDWSDYWRFDKTTGFYYYKTSLKTGETTKPLILGAEISSDVYEASEGYELRIDVIAESIQTTAGAEAIRAFY